MWEQSLCIENLERRLFLSTAASLTSRGTLAVTGSDASEVVSLRRKGGSIVVTQTGAATKSFSATLVKRIAVDVGGGDDRVFIDPGIGERVSVLGGAGNDTIDGSCGDTLVGGSGNDRLYLQPSSAGAVDLSQVFQSGGSVISSTGAHAGLLCGGAGNDTLIASSALDSVIGGSGKDTFVAQKTVEIRSTPTGPILVAGLAELSGIEVVTRASP